MKDPCLKHMGKDSTSNSVPDQRRTRPLARAPENQKGSRCWRATCTPLQA